MSDLGQRTPIVIAARRTPIGTAGHGLAGVDLVALMAPVLRALVEDLGPHAPDVDDVVMGNCRGPGGNPARVAALAAARPRIANASTNLLNMNESPEPGRFF